MPLRMGALQRRQEFTQRADVRLGRRDHDVGVGALAVDHAPVLRQPHGHLALRIGAAGDVVHRVEQQVRPTVDHRFERLEGGVDRARAEAVGLLFGAVVGEHELRVRRLARFRTYLHRHQLEALVPGGVAFVGHQRLQVLVEDFTLLVGEVLEAGERGVERLLAVEHDAEFGELGLEGVAAGQLAERQTVGVPADVLGAHDFVGLAVLQHAVLMDAGLVGEGVGADDRLVGLHHEAGDRGNQARSLGDHLGVDAGLEGHRVVAGAQRHHDLFERGVAGLLESVTDIAESTMHQLRYVGEWHSHPNRASVGPSGTDLQQLIWLAREMSDEGFPAIMVISGERKRYSIIIGDLTFEVSSPGDTA